MLVAFFAALRGEKVFKLVLGEARDYMAKTRKNLILSHIVLPLMGRFKGETGDSFYFAVVTIRKNSGLEI